MEKRKAVFPFSLTSHEYTGECGGKWMGKMGSGDVKRWGHAALSLRCPDPVSESSLASHKCEIDVQLALLCLKSFLLTPPSMRCRRSTSSSFMADEGKTDGDEGGIF